MPELVRPSLPAKLTVEELRRAIKLTSDNISRVNERLRGWDYTLTHGTELLVEKPVGYTVNKAIAVRTYDETLGIEGPPVVGLTVREATPTTLGITAIFDQSDSGIIGEQIRSFIAPASAVALSSPNDKNLTSINLEPGDWDITMDGGFTVSVAASEVRIGVNTTTGTLPNVQTQPEQYKAVIGPTSPSQDVQLSITNYRVSPTTTTTYYGVAKAIFASGTCSVYGRLSAVRTKKYDTAVSYLVTLLLLD